MSEMRIGKFQVLSTLGSGANSSILHIRREADGAWDPAKVQAAWSDNTDRQHEIYFQPFRADGRALAAARRVTTNSSASLIPAIVPTTDGFALAWNEYVAAASGKPATSQIAFTVVR